MGVTAVSAAVSPSPEAFRPDRSMPSLPGAARSCPPVVSFAMGSLGFLTPYDVKMLRPIVSYAVALGGPDTDVAGVGPVSPGTDVVGRWTGRGCVDKLPLLPAMLG